MGITGSEPCAFRAELAALTARGHGSADGSAGGSARQALFEALAGLERRALIGGAPDGTLQDIADARFLAGILREAVRPARSASLRAILRARGGPAADRAGQAGSARAARTPASSAAGFVAGA